MVPCNALNLSFSNDTGIGFGYNFVQVSPCLDVNGIPTLRYGKESSNNHALQVGALHHS
jgi:hypothetical protein